VHHLQDAREQTNAPTKQSSGIRGPRARTRSTVSQAQRHCMTRERRCYAGWRDLLNAAQADASCRGRKACSFGGDRLSAPNWSISKGREDRRKPLLRGDQLPERGNHFEQGDLDAHRTRRLVARRARQERSRCSKAGHERGRAAIRDKRGWGHTVL
jgi:hypothetical protein